MLGRMSTEFVIGKAGGTHTVQPRRNGGTNDPDCNDLRCYTVPADLWSPLASNADARSSGPLRKLQVKRAKAGLIRRSAFLVGYRSGAKERGIVELRSSRHPL